MWFWSGFLEDDTKMLKSITECRSEMVPPPLPIESTSVGAFLKVNVSLLVVGSPSLLSFQRISSSIALWYLWTATDLQWQGILFAMNQ